MTTPPRTQFDQAIALEEAIALIKRYVNIGLQISLLAEAEQVDWRPRIRKRKQQTDQGLNSPEKLQAVDTHQVIIDDEKTDANQFPLLNGFDPKGRTK